MKKKELNAILIRDSEEGITISALLPLFLI